MSETSEKSNDQDQELRRRFGSGDDKFNYKEVLGKSTRQSENLNLSPVDSENDQKIGSDVREKFILLLFGFIQVKSRFYPSFILLLNRFHSIFIGFH